MNNGEKTQGELLQERLEHKDKSAWLKINEEERSNVFSFCEGYKDFLNRAKTEREAIEYARNIAQSNGFVPLEDYINNNKRPNSNDRFYIENRGKNIILGVFGRIPVYEGLRIVGSHVDSPRIDLKANPLYEDADFGLLKTHYYGGIKKYQWTTIPLSIHGVIIKANGEKITINIGEDDTDPQFTITDLLIHLAKDQMDKKLSEGVSGEGLNVLVGSIPLNDEKVKEKVKINVLNILNEKYGITESDFKRAELSLVPAFKVRDIGFDRSMVGGYGQDDRVCAYSALQAIIQTYNQEHTTLCVLVDKEEIGSVGNSGAQSRFLENTIAEICALTTDNYSDITLRRTLSKTKFLSGDVTGGVDPTYDSVNEKRNASFLGKGVSIEKYTGGRGKSESSDASAEFVAEVFDILDKNNVCWQSGELGKVDVGGGGTIAQYLANLNMDVIDIGTPVLCMHSPFEISSKVDIYMTYRAYHAFYNA